jgi:hypothetical protein
LAKVQPAAKRDETDLLTIVSIGIVVYVLGNIVHEALGHGGACLATGGRPLLVTAVNMECSADNRLVIAGGSLMNVTAAGLFFLLARTITRLSSHLRYFLWLSMTLNLLSAFGYLAFSGIGGFGDWAMFIRGFSPQWAWRVGLTVAGAVGYIAAVRCSLLELRPLIGSEPRERFVLANRLCIPSYFAGGIVECLAGALNPQGWFLVAMSAAASTFGGSSGLLWAPQWLRGTSIPAGPDAAPMPIPRSWAWIVAAAVVGTCFILMLGPGIR